MDGIDKGMLQLTAGNNILDEITFARFSCQAVDIETNKGCT